MRLRVKDLAHIKSADFNDKADLTVIVGDNGTGKTLLLETYTLLSEEISSVRTSIISNLMTNFLEDFQVILDKDLEDFLKDVFFVQKSILEEVYGEEIPRRQLRKLVVEKLVASFPDILDGIQLNAFIKISNTGAINSYLKKNTFEMKKKFISLAESKILFNSSNIGDFDFINSMPLIEEENNIDFTLNLGPSFWRINSLAFSRLLPSVDEIHELSWPNIKKSISFRILNLFMHNKLNNDFIDVSNSDVLLIPTERNSIIANSNLRTRKELENSKVFSRYSEFSFTMEFLKFKEELGNHRYDFFEELHQFSDINTEITLNNDFDLNDLVKDIKIDQSKNKNINIEISADKDINMIHKTHSEKLEKMLGGHLVYDNRGELNSIVDFDGNIINRRLFSTKQNHISSFAILEDNLYEYDVVIIEEPEANLSLKAIKQLVDYLFELITTYSIKLILTTHNELFFQRLNLKLLKNPEISSSVYEFSTLNGGSELKLLEKNDFGYSVELFNSELEQIFNEVNDIQNNE